MAGAKLLHLGPLRCCQSRRAVYQLRRFLHRVQDSSSKEEENSRQVKRLGQVAILICLTVAKSTDEIDYGSDRAESVRAPSPENHNSNPNPVNRDVARSSTVEYDTHKHDGMPTTSLSDAQAVQQETHHSHFAHFMKPKFARAPIKEAGRVAYLGESSNLSLLVHDRHGTTDVVHYPLPDSVKGTRARLTELDNIEIDILHQRGAFLLPPRGLCDELVEAFFKWVAPVVPVINRGRFMHRYRDNKNPPSLLLLQAMLLAGSRVCTNQQLMDANGSTTPAAMTFYKRAKALYDANYEDDRVTIVQALVLMGWYWEGPEGTLSGCIFPYGPQYLMVR